MRACLRRLAGPLGAALLTALVVALAGLSAAPVAAASTTAPATLDCTGATSPVPAACADITPTVCVVKNGGQNGDQGFFGYVNNSGYTLEFTANGPNDEVIQVSGQPHTFTVPMSSYPPGANTSAFTYNWPGDKLQWLLGNPANSVYAAGSSASGSCPLDSVPQVGNVGVAAGVVLVVLWFVNRRRPLIPLLRGRSGEIS